MRYVDPQMHPILPMLRFPGSVAARSLHSYKTVMAPLSSDPSPFLGTVQDDAHISVLLCGSFRIIGRRRKAQSSDAA